MAWDGPPGWRSPVLVGREVELARLVAAVAAPPAVAVVEGESGIGKTRLVSELRQDPALAGRRFRYGWCRAIREPFPLGPVLEAVRTPAGELATAELSPLAGALQPLLPELAGVLPPRLEPLADPVAERYRVFRALVELLSAPGPAVLVLEDLHWADEQTIDFVRYLLGDPPAELSLVVTFRTEDVSASVRAVAAKPPAAVRRAEVVLAPLDPAQTGALAAAVLGLGLDAVPDGLVADLFARTSGSPFAIEELLALLPAVEAPVVGLRVPAGVRDPVLERVSRLPDDARAAVEAVAILPAPAGADLVAAVSGAPAPQTRQALAAALAEGVLVEDGPGVGFRHQLAAQAVSEQVPGPRRQELHRRAAAATLAADPRALGPAAHHLRYAGDLAAWAEVAERAATRAAEFGNFDEAARLREQVLREAPPPDPVHRGRIAVQLARADSDALGERDLSDLILAALHPDQPEPLRGELQFRAAVLMDHTRVDMARQRELTAQAVAELADRPTLQAWAMVCLGIPAGAGVPVAEHLQWLRRALASVPRMDDDPNLRMAVLGKAAMALLLVGEPSWRRAHDQLVASTTYRPDGRRALHAFQSVGLAAGHAGHHAVADRLLSRALATVSAGENPRLERNLRGARAVLDYCAGAWDGLTDRVAGLLEGSGAVDMLGELTAVRACLALAQGDLDNAATLAGQVTGPLAYGGEFGPYALATGAAIRLALNRGDADGARERTDRLWRALESKQIWAPLARCLPALVQATLAGGRPDQAARLVAHADAELAGLDLPLAPAALRHGQGLLAAAAGRQAEAAHHLLVAGDRYAAHESPYESAQAREQAAECLLAGGSGPGGEQLREAITAYRRLGARWDADRAVRTARRHRVPVPARHGGGRRAYGMELSPREWEVARLAAHGRTNLEIARELFLSRNTVKKHLAAAMRKQGVPSRAALAHRLGAGEQAAASKDGPPGP